MELISDVNESRENYESIKKSRSRELDFSPIENSTVLIRHNKQLLGLVFTSESQSADS